MKLNSYLFFNGQCEAAFKFYEKCLGGKIEAMLTHEGTPAEQDVPSEWRKKILHARLTVGDQESMGSDAPPDRYDKPQGFSVSLNVDKPADAEAIFSELSSKGSELMPLEQTSWADRYGMCVDRFG